MSFNMRRNTKKGRTRFKSMRHGKTRRVQRGGAPRAVMYDAKVVGTYDDTTGMGSANYPGVGEYDGHFLDGVPHGQGTLRYSDGNVYEGHWANDQRNGHGKLTFADRDVYEGEWRNDAMHGRGIMKFLSGSMYDGLWSDDLRNGRGTMRYSDERVYEGNWLNDKRHGQGTMSYADGDVYVGEWLNDQKSGEGTMRYADGREYVGRWLNDERSGKGRMTYASGSMYDGSWLDDRMNGHGRYTFDNGDVYVGRLEAGDFTGQGIMTYANGDVYDGQWRSDLKNGPGTMTYANQDVYEGMWDANFMHGHGKMTYANRDVYEGPWRHNQMHGADGKMIYADGRVYEGEWWNDAMHGDGKMTDANEGVMYEGLWRDNQQNPLFNPNTGALADNAEYNATLARPPRIFPRSDHMLYQSDKYHDIMELQNKLVLDALAQDPNAIALKVNRTYYVVSMHDIVRIANNKNFIQYECPILVDLNVNQDDLERVIKTEPYLSINGMGIALVGVVPLFDIWSAIKSDHRAFELVATRRVLSTASHQVMFKYGSLVSSNHCQSGIPATVYEMQMLQIASNPRNKSTGGAKKFRIKKNGTKKLNRVINFMRGVRKQSHVQTQSHVR